MWSGRSKYGQPCKYKLISGLCQRLQILSGLTLDKLKRDLIYVTSSNAEGGYRFSRFRLTYILNLSSYTISDDTRVGGGANKPLE